MARRLLPFAILLALVCSGAAAQAPQSQAHPRAGELRAKLRRDLERIAAEFDGVMGIVVKDLTSGEVFQVNAELVFPQASSIKIAVLVEVFRQAQAGALKLDERVEVKRAQMVGGSGVLQHFGDGTSLMSLGDLAALMAVVSDNTATNLLIERVGMQNVNDTLKRLGLSQTRLQRLMMDVEARRAARENVSTPREMATLLELLYQGKALDPERTTAAMKILTYPKDNPTPLRRGLPAGIELADKPGELDGVRCDSGIVLLAGRPYLIAVMATYARDNQAAERAISEVSRRAYDYFERLARSSPYGVRLP